MPEFLITAPDGKRFRITAPEGATREQALEKVKSRYTQQQTEAKPTIRPFEEFQKQGIGIKSFPKGDNSPLSNEFTQSLQQSVNKTNQAIQKGGLDERFKDLPFESVIKIKKQLQRGGPDSSQRLINLEKIRLDNPAIANEIENMSAGKVALVGAGKATEDIAQGIGRLTGILDQKDVLDSPEYQALASARPAAGRGEIAANIAAFAVPASKVAQIPATGARIAAGLGLGALEGGLPAAGRGEEPLDVAKQATIGAGSQIAGGELFNYGGNLLRRFSGRESTEPQVRPELQQALDNNGVTLNDFPEPIQRQLSQELPANVEQSIQQQIRRQDLERAGLTGDAAPTRAQVERTKELFTKQELLARQSNLVNRRLEAQNAAMQGRFDDAIQATQGTTGHGGATAYDAIRQKSLDLDQSISQVYKMADLESPMAKVISLTNTAEALRKISPINDLSRGTVKAIYKHMQEMGMLGKRFKPQARITMRQAEDLRQFANKLYEGSNPQGKEVIRVFKNAIFDDTVKTLPDRFAIARKLKNQFEIDLRRTKSDKFDLRTTSLVRDVLDNKLDPGELVNKAVINRGKYRAEDLQHLRRYLETGTEEQRLAGQIAWNDLRAETMDWIRNQATKGAMGENEMRGITATGLEGAIRRIGRDKLQVLFSPEENELLDIMTRAARLREPPPGTYQGGGPSALAIKKLSDKLGVFGTLFDEVKTRLNAKQMLRVTTLADTIDNRKITLLQRLLPLRYLPTGSANAANVALNTQEKKP